MNERERRERELTLRDRGGEVLPDKLLDWLQLSTDAKLQPISISVPTLQLLGGPQATERSVDHDPHSRAEGLALGHAVSGDEDRLTRRGHAPDDGPQELAGGRVHTRCRLILDRL